MVFDLFLIPYGEIPSSCMMMDAPGPRGEAQSSSSFFSGISDWIKKTTEPGEEINSLPSQGVGQRLPGSLEISSPGISGESLFRDLEQPSREPSPQPGAAPPAPNLPPVEPPTVSETKERLRDFLSSFGKRRASSSFIDRIADELHLEHASPQKRGAILEIMTNLSQRRGQSGLNSGQNAAAVLTTRIVNWEESQGD